jgi:chemotaxis protein MotB
MGKKKKKGDGGASWLITFSDLVTLLLTFFVLLLSMSSMDRSFLTKVAVFTKDIGVLSHKGSGRVPARHRMVINLLERPWEVIDKTNRIKDLLFPDEILPPEISRSVLYKNLSILAKPEGVALVLNDELLFPSGGHELTPTAEIILGQVYEMLSYMDAAVNIAGHSDNDPSPNNYLLSGKRAFSVLAYFLENNMNKSRFSYSGYGPDQPAGSNESLSGKAKNRRVEILVKTTPWVGSYPN